MTGPAGSDGFEGVRVQGDVVTDSRAVFTSKPVVTALCLIALSVAVYAVPGLERLRVFDPRPRDAEPLPTLSAEATEGEAEIDMATRSRPELAQPERVHLPRGARGPIATRETTDELPKIDAERPPRSIEDKRHSLDRFFAALSKTARGVPGAVTRILYYGDSVVASDFGTGTLRRKLQKQFGDAGHGFVLVANAWPQYFHNDVYRLASRGWKVSRIVGPYKRDGLYGLGAVSFSAPPGLRSRVGTTKEGSFGRTTSKFSIAYLKQPHGGTLKVNVDDAEHSVIETAAPEKAAGFHTVDVPDGPHLFEVVTAKATTRLFGFVLERDVPGVVLDAVGIVGARLRFLDKQDDVHWKQQVAWRNPNLVVFQFGANASGDGFAYPMPEYHRTMKEVVQKLQRFAPNAGCLVVGAMDRSRKEGQRLVTVPIIPHIVEEQKKVAQETGCAFFDTFAAMGGRGSMAKWVARGLGAGDFTHPTSVGAEVIGNWVYGGLIERYEEYRTRDHD